MCTKVHDGSTTYFNMFESIFYFSGDQSFLEKLSNVLRILRKINWRKPRTIMTYVMEEETSGNGLEIWTKVLDGTGLEDIYGKAGIYCI